MGRNGARKRRAGHRMRHIGMIWNDLAHSPDLAYFADLADLIHLADLADLVDLVDLASSFLSSFFLLFSFTIRPMN